MKHHTTQEQIDEMRREIQRERQKMIGGGKADYAGGAVVRDKRRVKRVVGQTVFLIVVFLLSAAIISIQVARSRGEIPNLLGFQLYVVQSGSMEPTLNVGTVILSRKPEHPESLAVNDIVTFKSLSGPVITHRIVETVTDGEGNIAYRTKGDNPRNSIDVELLTPDRVLGKFMARIPLT